MLAKRECLANGSNGDITTGLVNGAVTLRIASARWKLAASRVRMARLSRQLGTVTGPSWRIASTRLVDAATMLYARRKATKSPR